MFTGFYYAVLLVRFDIELQKTRYFLVKKNVLFQHDNASAYIFAATTTKLDELGYELLPYFGLV